MFYLTTIKLYTYPNILPRYCTKWVRRQNNNVNIGKIIYGRFV